MKSLEINIHRKVYSNDLCTIQDLVFSAEKGEFIAIVGPSGAGKTTLLNIVAGLDQDVDGEILINGTPLNNAIHARESVGFLFQESRLMPWLTALENVQLVLDGKSADVEHAKALLKQLGLEEFEHAFPGQMSGGMQRRVALARAFALQPSLLLMDEPFQSLDSPTADRLRGLLLDLWGKAQPIILFVTHNLREALALADRVIFLSARPACVVDEISIEIPRPRQLDDKDVSMLYERLLYENPQLLSGVRGRSSGDKTEGKNLSNEVSWFERRIG